VCRGASGGGEEIIGIRFAHNVCRFAEGGQPVAWIRRSGTWPTGHQWNLIRRYSLTLMLFAASLISAGRFSWRVDPEHGLPGKNKPATVECSGLMVGRFFLSYCRWAITLLWVQLFPPINKIKRMFIHKVITLIYAKKYCQERVNRSSYQKCPNEKEQKTCYPFKWL